MTLETIYSILQVSLAPIVLISACGLICLVFYNRLAVIVSRLRALHKDLSMVEKGSDEYTIIEAQIVLILRRAHQIRMTLGLVITTIVMMLLTSLSFSIVSLASVAVFSIIGFVFFYVGLLSMLGAMFFAIKELYRSLLPVELECVRAE